SAGTPRTPRDAASAVAFVTGHEDPEKPGSALDWDALARFPGTLVFYMGIRQLPLISARLAASGRTPRGARTDCAAGGRAEDIRPPAISVVAPVAELRETIAWLERRPLHGE